MKKVLFAISVAALALVSCAKFEPEQEVTFERASAPSVTVNVTGDNSVYFEVLPGKNTGYYAYAFLKGEVDGATVDAASLIAGKLANAIATEVANSAKKDTLKKEVTKLTSNTKYTVVAVASSTGTQSLSAVVAQTVTTTDETAPDVVLDDYKCEVKDSVMVYYVPFDDPVTLTEDAAFVVRVYAKNVEGAAPYYLLSPVATVPVPADNVKVDKDGQTVVVTVPKEAYAPGAYTALFIGAGSVKNALDAVNAAFTDNYIVLHGDYKAATSGLLGQYDEVPFELVNPIEEDDYVAFQDETTVAIELVSKLAGTGNTLFAGEKDIIVTAVNSKTGRKVEYTLQNWNIDAATGTKVILGLDEAVEAFSNVSYSIAAGAVEDVYGNNNKALDITDQVYCNFYTPADLVGSWTYEAKSAYGAKYNETGSWVFAASDNPSKGNIMLTVLFDTPNDFNVYCDFDVRDLVLTVPSGAPFMNYIEYQLNEDKTAYVLDDDGYPVVAEAGVLLAACKEDDFVTFDFAPGTLSNPSDEFGYFYYSTTNSSNSGWWNRFSDITLTKDADPAPAPAPAHSGLRAVKGLHSIGKK